MASKVVRKRLFLKIISIMIFLTAQTVLFAENPGRKLFVRKYSNPHLSIIAFDFLASGKCSIVLDNPETNKADKYDCKWKQEGQTNKLIVSWLSARYRQIAQIPSEGDVYYLIIDGDSKESRRHCLVRSPIEYDRQKFQNHDLMELSNGLQLCSRD